MSKTGSRWSIWRWLALGGLAGFTLFVSVICLAETTSDSSLTEQQKFYLEQGYLPPVAHAGEDQTVQVGERAVLDGSWSSSPNQTLITYSWQVIERPENSQTPLQQQHQVRAALKTDQPGRYVVQLVVSDPYFDSEPDTVVISTINSSPVANAGPDQTAFIDSAGVTLDGTASYDVDNDLLSYQWRLSAKPELSLAEILDPSAPVTQLAPIDQPGQYIAGLVVNDSTADSAADHVIITTDNSRPVANAGPNLETLVGQAITLDGSQSFDADGDVLAYQWSLITAPDESLAVLTSPELPMAGFLPDVDGDYVAQLLVNDGQQDSLPDSALIVVHEKPNQPPVFDSEPVTQARVGKEYSYQVLVSDPDNQPVTVSLTLGPDGMQLTADNRLIWTPLAEDSVDVSLLAKDDKKGEAVQAFAIQVAPPNQLPQIASTPITEAFIGEAYQYQVIASDPEGGPLDYALDTPPAGMTIQANGVINWVPDIEGDFSVQVIVKDEPGDSAYQSFSIHVIQSDTTPPDILISSPPDNSVTNQASITLNGSLSEPATLTINGQPVTVDEQLAFSFPLTLTEGLNSYTLVAVDDAGNQSERIWRISLDSIPPVLTVTEPNDGVAVATGSVLVAGDVSEAAVIRVNDQVIAAQVNSFSATVNLQEGENLLRIRATDVAGNQDAEDRTVIFDNQPPAIPVINLIERGDPVNGVVMVAGATSSAEPGALVHVINPSTGYTALVLARSDGSFSTDVAAFANHTLDIYQKDAAGNQSPTAQLAPVQPAQLVLNPIGSQQVTLGQTLKFTVTANAGNGESIDLDVVPLPPGASFNRLTGEFAYPAEDPATTSFELVFSASTGAERVEETVPLQVNVPTAGSPTLLEGRVLDAQALDQGDLLPIVGAVVSFQGTGISDTTDAEGYFQLVGLPNQGVFSIDGSNAQPAPTGEGYASFNEFLELIPGGVNREERAFTMPRIAVASVTPINTAGDTLVSNNEVGVSFVIPAGAAKNEDGTAFTGSVSVSPVPRDLTPAAMPDFLQPAQIVTIQPEGVVFDPPAPIRFPNSDVLPPGTETDIWSLDPDSGQFIVVGTGKVSTDGLWIDTIAGGIRRADWHAPAPNPPNNTNDPDPNNPDRQCKGCPPENINSTVDLVDGRMQTDISPPGYRSLGRERRLSFVYTSSHAYPAAGIPYNAVIPSRSANPPRLSHSLQVGGYDAGTRSYIQPGSRGVSWRGTAFMPVESLPTGMHPYRLRITAHYGFQASGSELSLIKQGQTMVINYRSSSFGAGWTLSELYELQQNVDGSLLLVSATGNSQVFRSGVTPGRYEGTASNFDWVISETDGSFTHHRKTGETMSFNADGQLVFSADRNDNRTGYHYLEDGRLSHITDPVGLQYSFAYDQNKRLASVTDPGNRITQFTVDAAGDLVEVIYPDQTSETFAYDNRHLMQEAKDERRQLRLYEFDRYGKLTGATLPDGTQRSASGQIGAGILKNDSFENPDSAPRPDQVFGTLIDGRGNPYQKTHDANGRLLTDTDPLDRTMSYQRDANSLPLKTVRKNGSVLNKTFDTQGNVLTSTESFNSAQTRTTYDSLSLPLTQTNANDHTTVIERDARGNPEKITNAAGHITQMTYDSRGLVQTRLDANGTLTSYTYNAEGLLETQTVTPPQGTPGAPRLTRFAYTASGRLKQLDTPDGITLAHDYDERDRLLRITDNIGQRTENSYDEEGNLVGIQLFNVDGSPASAVAYDYDERDRRIATRLPHQGGEVQSTQQYDENSNLIATRDEKGQPEGYAYDLADRLIQHTHRLNGVTTYTYDKLDRITSVTAPNGSVTQYRYDDLGRRTAEISQDRGALTYDYDRADNLIQSQDARGITATYTYDELERLTHTSYSNTRGYSEDITLIYDDCPFGKGRLCARIDESGRTDYAYGPFGNLLSQTWTDLNNVRYTTGYQYDDGDNLIGIAYPSGRIVNITRDGLRRINTINTTINSQVTEILSNIHYRADNQMTQCTYGNGLQDQRVYDLQGRLTDQQLQTPGNAVIDQRQYRYDANGNITDIQHADQAQSYGYDALDRLIRDTISDQATFTTKHLLDYDLNHNRLVKQTDGQPEQLSYQPQSNRLLVSEVLTDTATAPSQRTYAYNDANRRYQVYDNGTLTTTYRYNSQGQRTHKSEHDQNGTITNTTVYHYDQNGTLISETDGQGVPQRDYLWHNSSPVAQIDYNNTGTETVHYLYTNHLQTPRLATNESGIITWQWQGEAFGDTKPEQDIDGDGLNTIVNLRFPGQYYDQETELNYNYFRDYDPSTGRYIESDPIGLDGGLNTYLYVNGNALRYIDPLGLKTCGTGWNEPFVPDNPSGFPFSGCCEVHDDCYGDCKNKPTKSECDFRFWNCMMAKCRRYDAPHVKAQCERLANIYAGAVSNMGQGAFDDARKNCSSCEK